MENISKRDKYGPDILAVLADGKRRTANGIKKAASMDDISVQDLMEILDDLAQDKLIKRREKDNKVLYSFF